MSDMLTTAEAAEFCGIPVRTWQAYYQVWEVPHFRIGRALRFNRDEIASWLESRREA